MKDGILSRAEAGGMEMRVMSVGCTDRDFRFLMDSHEALRLKSEQLQLELQQIKEVH